MTTTAEILDTIDHAVSDYTSNDAMRWVPDGKPVELEQAKPENPDWVSTNPLREWQHAGLKCAIHVGPAGDYLCGYVQVPRDNPAFGAPGDRVDGVVDAHGGLTYGPDRYGWIGFDTGHAFDHWSISELESAGAAITDELLASRARLGELHEICGRAPVLAWTVQKLIDETNSLASQLSLVTHIPRPNADQITDDELEALYVELDRLRATSI